MEKRSLRLYPEENEYLIAIKEDLSEWLEKLYPNIDINSSNFFNKLETGSLLMQHANTMLVRQGKLEMNYRTNVEPGSWFARDNVHNFISFCRSSGIKECVMFETEDLVGRRNEKHVIFTLLDIARHGVRLGILAPLLVQYEKEIDDEIKLSNGAEYESPIGPMPQIKTKDLKNIDEMVHELVSQCQCQTQFFARKITDGKYQVGETKNIIFIRILRKHVMVRVGGGWDTLKHYLYKHDQCRQKQKPQKKIFDKAEKNSQIEDSLSICSSTISSSEDDEEKYVEKRMCRSFLSLTFMEKKQSQFCSLPSLKLD